MADSKISALPTDIATLADGDKFAVADASALTADTYATALEIYNYIRTKLLALGLPVVAALTGDYTNSTTSGTVITGLTFAGLAAGTYIVQWTLFVATAATSTSFKFGVNYTGTVTRMMNMAQITSAGVTAATGTTIDVANATTGQVLAYANSTTETTTAPNLGPWVGVTNANLFQRVMVESILVVSDGGDLEIYGASEVGASQITVKAGSSGILYKTN